MAALSSPKAKGIELREGLSEAAVAATARTMEILERLSYSKEGASVASLTRDLGAYKSVVSRILATLASEGYVVKDPATDMFRLTFKLSKLVFRQMDQIGLPDFAAPAMKRLAAETGELTALAVVEGDALTLVSQVNGAREGPRIGLMTGQTLKLHATAAGKAWLSTLPEERAMQIVLSQGLAPVTPHTIVNIDELRRQWSQVREEGVAYAMSEAQRWSSSIAAPIFPRSRRRSAVGSVTLVTFDVRFPPDRLRAYAPKVIELADEIGSDWPLELLASGVWAEGGSFVQSDAAQSTVAAV